MLPIAPKCAAALKFNWLVEPVEVNVVPSAVVNDPYTLITVVDPYTEV